MRRGARWIVLLMVFAALAFAAGEGKSEEPDMIGWKWANFAILAAGIGYLMVKQAGPFFAERSQAIRKGIEESQKLRSEADARAAAMEAKLAKLSEEVESLRNKSKAEAEQENERIRQETERELARMQANAEHEIASALKTAQLELKRYSAQLAVDLAGARVRDSMTAATQDALVRNFVAEFGHQEQGKPS
jgi:F-type H+-transporting ATPase subunit b